jgi:hypothetical protein
VIAYLQQAFFLFKRHPDYSSVQVEIHDKSEELYDRATKESDVAHSPARSDLYQKLWVVQARAYVRLVDDIEHQEAYELILRDNVRKVWAQYAKVDEDLFETTAGRDTAFMQAMKLLLQHWITEGHRRIANKKSSAESPIVAPVVLPQKHADFLNRAAWLRERLRERGWTNNTPSQFGGPDHKTISRILSGRPVQDGTLDKLLSALNKVEKLGKLRSEDIPST